MSWISKKTGRPREEEGHVRKDITLSKLIDCFLDDVPNKSQYIEDLIFCDNLFSGKQSVHIIECGDGIFYAQMLGEKSRFRKVPDWLIQGFMRESLQALSTR